MEKLQILIWVHKKKKKTMEKKRNIDEFRLTVRKAQVEKAACTRKSTFSRPPVGARRKSSASLLGMIDRTDGTLRT